MKYVVFMCRTIKILISNWPRTRKFSQLLQAGKTVAFDFSRHVHALVTLYVQFYALIGQNLTGEFMRKIYAASWNWVILTAEADRVLCQIGMFLTVFFHWMYKTKYSCHKFIGCLVDKCATCQSRESNFGWHHFCFPLCSM